MNKPVRIAFVIYEQMLLTSLTLPIEMLRAGEAFARRHDRTNFRAIETSLLSEHGAPIENGVLAPISSQSIASVDGNFDFVVVPSIWRNPRPVIRQSLDTIAWLANSWQQGSTLIGVGTGVCLLAESGLLNTHSATTHWHYADQFKRDYPKVLLKPDFFITQSERLYTVASLNALADVIVHLIAQFYGTLAAQHVQRNFSHEVRKPYEEQRFLEGGNDRHPDELMAAIQFWLKTNIANEIDFSQLAEQFGISYRTLTRRFKQATGQSVLDYLQKLRVEAAIELLASSNLTIQDIALAIGLSNQSQFTRLFKQHLGQTPSEYRKVVRKKLFS
ncbi:GlxA family transcriptional regulator [Pseudoalteromonas fenneropenaei]|uniref:GlxA family transcriptional regulator n=1 Tax=Pseudoalteromonas fenneropenaei TaxID=1737459 RepID=A0ABV7CF98_9GAMM